MINKKYILIIFITIFFLTALTANTYAATGSQGYAVYRDGAFYGTTWHAGIMYKPYSTDTKPVIQASGSGTEVDRVTWLKFIGTNTDGDYNNFKGVYRPRTNPSTTDRDRFVTMAKKLADANIAYSLTYQVNYDPDDVGSIVNVSDIISMRCDGVVEYVYEWYEYRVYGEDNLWDITYADEDIRNSHAFAYITPYKQISYLRLVSSNEPIEK